MDKFEWPDSREHMERMAKEDSAGDFGDGVHTCSIMCGCFQLRLRDHVEALEAKHDKLREALEKFVAASEKTARKGVLLPAWEIKALEGGRRALGIFPASIEDINNMSQDELEARRVAREGEGG